MTQCAAISRAGKRCRNHAVRGSEPPLCSNHHPDHRFGQGGFRLADDYRLADGPLPGPDPAPPGEREHGLYDDHFTDAELARLLSVLNKPPLGDEISVARITLARLLGHLSADPAQPAGQVVSLAPLIFEGARTVGRLLRDQRAISNEAMEKFNEAIGQVLQEIGKKFGLPL